MSKSDQREKHHKQKKYHITNKILQKFLYAEQDDTKIATFSLTP